ncbi:putative cytochrome P450 pisatin demethylase [Aspergillus homomorphus CBS 101889]|uniref:Cytochrome P450 n=1 Tax=Aspergillus homomorphus (strain CBS 101889) TaxID=1450537 RepID=A0A395IBF0_ASPHC|nr:cytochrome P450 [Aspergillus homomorphus CBS 101889]RAL17139.1 cytochrome P450 [Aspergillus homomorphus CBS 101889]
MVSAILVLLQLALAALVAHVIYCCYFHPLARYPGPFLARVTNIWGFTSFLRGQHHLSEESLHRKHGPVVRVAPNWLSFSRLEDFEAIYGINKAIEKGDFYAFGQKRSQSEASVFAAKSNPVHRQKKRKMLGPALTSSKVVRYEPIITRHVAGLVARLDALQQEQADGSLTGGGAVNVAPLVHRFTVDVMLDILFGSAVGPRPYTDGDGDDDGAGDICTDLRRVSKMAWSCSLWPAFGWVMNSHLVNACIRRASYNAEGAPIGLTGLMSRGYAAIVMSPEKFAVESQPGIVKSWLEVSGGDAHRMTRSEAMAEAFNLVFAGPGSMAAVLTAVLYQLGLPEGRMWQEKLRDEPLLLHESSTDASQSIELQAVIKETMRVRSAFPTAFPRVIMPGAESAIPGLHSPLPAGTTVSANTYVLGRSREIWGDDADQWKPQRWLGDQDHRRRMENKFVAFSKGPRGCSGKELASLILAKAVMAIAHRWRITSAAELRGRSYLEMQYDDCRLSFTQLSPVTS